MRDYTPGAHQREITGHILSTDRGNIWSEPGTGKTVATLTALDILHNLLGEDRPTLILGPLRIVRKVWPDEVRKWRHLSALDITAVHGNALDRQHAVRRDVPLHACNYENLPWLVKHWGKHWPYRRVIADESTRLKSFRLRQGSVRAAALRTLAHREIKHWHNLTGTPAPNGLNDLWGQNWFCDRGFRLGATFDAFHNRWFRATPRKDGQRTRIVYEPQDWAQAQIEGKLADITVTITNPLGVDKPVFNTILVDLPPAARRQYREMEDEFFTEIEGVEIEALFAASRSQKCMQMASGAVYGADGKTWHSVHDALLDALESLIEEAAGQPVLVAYQWKHDWARIKKRFSFARSIAEGDEVIDLWNAGKVPLLGTHPKSAGHGLSLQDGGHILAFFGLWWDYELYAQVIERIGPARQKQSGHNRSVYVHHLIAADTLHETALEKLETKCSVETALMNAMVKRGRK